MITVITTLNPRIKRLDARGLDIGIDYQQRCLNSWRQAGARVVSINAEDEIHHLERLGYDAAFVSVKTTPFMPGGKALPTIFSALEVARRYEDDVIFLTNSDIFYAAGPERLQLIEAAVEDGGFLVANRFDVQGLESGSGYPQPWGHDLFAFHSRESRLLDPGIFAYGSPWWDYWLPINALFSGLELKFLECQDFRHMIHDQAWSWSSWNFGCWAFIKKFQYCLESPEKITGAHNFGLEFLRYMMGRISNELQQEIRAERDIPAPLGMEMSRFVLKTIREASRHLK